MKTKIKKLWVNALRSAKYKQTNLDNCFKDEYGRFDVLGVLCDLYRKETGLGRWSHGVLCNSYQRQFLSATSCLPIDVAMWAGIDTDDMLVPIKYRGSMTTLAFLSDESGLNRLDFDGFADLIENQL